VKNLGYTSEFLAIWYALALKTSGIIDTEATEMLSA